TGEPTGMMRNADGALKVKTRPAPKAAGSKRDAVKKLFAMYNSYGITSGADRNCDRSALDLYFDLAEKNELTVRLNCARAFSAGGSRNDIIARLEALPGKDGRGGPTGK